MDEATRRAYLRGLREGIGLALGAVVLVALGFVVKVMAGL